MYTEEINKTALSINDDKRLPTFDRITAYPYETNEMMLKQSEIYIHIYIYIYIHTYIYIKISISMITQMKKKLKIIKIGYIFQIIHTEY